MQIFLQTNYSMALQFRKRIGLLFFYLKSCGSTSIARSACAKDSDYLQDTTLSKNKVGLSRTCSTTIQVLTILRAYSGAKRVSLQRTKPPQPTNTHLTNGPNPLLRSLLSHSEYTSGYGVTFLQNASCPSSMPIFFAAPTRNTCINQVPGQ